MVRVYGVSSPFSEKMNYPFKKVQQYSAPFTSWTWFPCPSYPYFSWMSCRPPQLPQETLLCFYLSIKRKAALPPHIDHYEYNTTRYNKKTYIAIYHTMCWNLSLNIVNKHSFLGVPPKYAMKAHYPPMSHYFRTRPQHETKSIPYHGAQQWGVCGCPLTGSCLHVCTYTGARPVYPCPDLSSVIQHTPVTREAERMHNTHIIKNRRHFPSQIASQFLTSSASVSQGKTESRGTWFSWLVSAVWSHMFSRVMYLILSFLVQWNG